MGTAAIHQSRVIASPWPGVYATDIVSGRRYGRHWHTSFGCGVIDAGAHRSASRSVIADLIRNRRHSIANDPGSSPG